MKDKLTQLAIEIVLCEEQKRVEEVHSNFGRVVFLIKIL